MVKMVLGMVKMVMGRWWWRWCWGCSRGPVSCATSSVEQSEGCNASPTLLQRRGETIHKNRVEQNGSLAQSRFQEEEEQHKEWSQGNAHILWVEKSKMEQRVDERQGGTMRFLLRPAERKITNIKRGNHAPGLYPHSEMPCSQKLAKKRLTSWKTGIGKKIQT